MKRYWMLEKIMVVALAFASIIPPAQSKETPISNIKIEKIDGGGAGSSGGGTAEAALFRRRGDELLTALIKGRAIVTTPALAAGFSSQVTDDSKATITEEYITLFREALDTPIQSTTNRVIYDESQGKVIDEKTDKTGLEKGEMYVTVPSTQIHFLLLSLPYWKDLSKKKDIEGQYALALHAYSRAMSAKVKKYENAAYESGKILSLLEKMSLLDLKASEKIRYEDQSGKGHGCEEDYRASMSHAESNTSAWFPAAVLTVGILALPAVTSTHINNNTIEDRTQVLSVIEQAKLGKGIDLIRFARKIEFSQRGDVRVDLERLSDVIMDMNSARVICPQGRDLLSFDEFYQLIKAEIFP